MSQAALFFSHKAYPFPPTLSDRSNREDGFPGWVAESRDEGDGARNPSAKKRKETSLSRHTRAMRAVKLTRQYDCVIRAKHVTRTPPSITWPDPVQPFACVGWHETTVQGMGLLAGKGRIVVGGNLSEALGRASGMCARRVKQQEVFRGRDKGRSSVA